jgi:hypothetical protein
MCATTACQNHLEADADEVTAFLQRMRVNGRECVAITRAEADAEIAREEARMTLRPRVMTESHAAHVRRERELLLAIVGALHPHRDRRIPSARIVIGRYLHCDKMPTDWAVPVESGEVPIALARLPEPHVGFASLIVRVTDLPRPQPSDAERTRIAERLTDALLQEVGS